MKLTNSWKISTYKNIGPQEIETLMKSRSYRTIPAIRHM